MEIHKWIQQLDACIVHDFLTPFLPFVFQNYIVCNGHHIHSVVGGLTPCSYELLYPGRISSS